MVTDQLIQTKTPEPEHALVVHIVVGRRQNIDDDYAFEEIQGLARAINLDIVCAQIITMKRVQVGNYFGRGTIDSFAQVIDDHEIKLLIVNSSLTPIQQRNLERALHVKVIDRSGLILEIFGARANTHEGRLQVRLAGLIYQRSRLVRGWTHLERQRGALGFVGGPGESQLEIDRRLIGSEIDNVKRRIDKVSQRRALQRNNRKKSGIPLIALVGYTNSGKSTLFRQLTQNANTLVADKLFATLDPQMRVIALDMPPYKAIISDTVGFVADLPHELVVSFRATLEEVVNADILIHVRDITHPNTAKQAQDVEQVLQGFDLPKDQILLNVFNKVDRLDGPEYNSLAQLVKSNNKNQYSAPIMLSALHGQGCTNLLEKIGAVLASGMQQCQVCVPYSDWGQLSAIYEVAKIYQRNDLDDQAVLDIAISNEARAKLLSQFPDLQFS